LLNETIAIFIFETQRLTINRTRILGYDNAHGVKTPGKFKYAGRIMTHDHTHRHKEDKGAPYEFQDAQQLLIDFFENVDRVLREAREK